MPPSIALNLIEEEFKDLFTSLPMLSLEREGALQTLAKFACLSLGIDHAWLILHRRAVGEGMLE